jgi:hypothetical protein
MPWLITASFKCPPWGHTFLLPPLPLLAINPSSCFLPLFLFPHILSHFCHPTLSWKSFAMFLVFMVPVKGKLFSLCPTRQKLILVPPHPTKGPALLVFNAMWKGHYIYFFHVLQRTGYTSSFLPCNSCPPPNFQDLPLSMAYLGVHPSLLHQRYWLATIILCDLLLFSLCQITKHFSDWLISTL